MAEAAGPVVSTVGVAGAGTMGLGIAAVAALGGFETVVHDPDPGARASAAERADALLRRGTGRRWSAEQVAAALARLHVADGLDGFAPCELVIEAAPESLELKRELFAALAAAVAPEALLATNTSSISIESIAAGVPAPERVLGLHFFNPATVMELVEVVAGSRTAPAAVESAAAAVAAMGKTGIRVADGIGFLANRCARPFTLEGLRSSDALGVPPAEVDRICRIGGGFPMGPFELIDLVGADVNLNVAESFFEQSFGEPRWRPHRTQVRMVASGRLGRKSGEGFYVYGDGRYRDEDPAAEDPRPIVDRERLAELAGPMAPEVLERITAQIVNEACFALEEGVGAEADVDTAMRLGYRWPLGPFELGRSFGLGLLLERLERMRELYGEAYRPAPRLRELA